MPNSELPARPSLEYLKKLAKDRLHALRKNDPHAKLATALLSIARESGFSSWRALKAEVEQRQTRNLTRFFDACAQGDVASVRALVANDPELVHASDPNAHHGGWTGLHTSSRKGHAGLARLLLEHGANPNARESGDNTSPLHWAAASGHVETVRALLDAGADVNGFGDVHELDVIGWATFYHAPGPAPGDNPQVVSLLVERGARHHIFSAISVGDPILIQNLVEQNPGALDRRLSRFEQGQTPLHYAINRKRYDILNLLIELGADLEAEDRNGHTAFATAMLLGNREAMSRLHAAGARQPEARESSEFSVSMALMAESVNHGAAMINVPDVAQSLAWYKSIGFREVARNEDDGLVNWGMVSFGRVELMFNAGGTAGTHDVSLWFYTNQIDRLYQMLKSRQLELAKAALAGKPDAHERIEFVEHINDPFYGGREFGIRDLNGYKLFFRQPPTSQE